MRNEDLYHDANEAAYVQRMVTRDLRDHECELSQSPALGDRHREIVLREYEADIRDGAGGNLLPATAPGD